MSDEYSEILGAASEDMCSGVSATSYQYLSISPSIYWYCDQAEERGSRVSLGEQ